MMFGTRSCYKYYKCSNCGVLQIAQPVQDVDKLYPGDYYSFSGSANSLKSRIKKFVKYLSVGKTLNSKKFHFFKLPESKEAAALQGIIKRDMNILDVGCGSGDLLDALFHLGFKKVNGVDPFIAKDIIKDGWKVEKKFLTELPEDNLYDLIMLHHSFEHMDNPQEILTKIKSLLSPDGLCIIRIPVSDSYAYDHYKNNWVQLDAPRHVFLHTNKSINYLVNSVGLSLNKIVDDSDVFQFIGSEQYKKDISLISAESYYVPVFKRIFRRPVFTKAQIESFRGKTIKLNVEGKGDQRIFYIKK